MRFIVKPSGLLASINLPTVGHEGTINKLHAIRKSDRVLLGSVPLTPYLFASTLLTIAELTSAAAPHKQAQLDCVVRGVWSSSLCAPGMGVN
jgi:hypothetical protein